MPARLRRHRKRTNPRGAGPAARSWPSWRGISGGAQYGRARRSLVLGAKAGSPQVLLDILKDQRRRLRMVDVRGPLMVEHRFEPQMKPTSSSRTSGSLLEEGQRLGVPLR